MVLCAHDTVYLTWSQLQTVSSKRCFLPNLWSAGGEDESFQPQNFNRKGWWALYPLTYRKEQNGATMQLPLLQLMFLTVCFVCCAWQSEKLSLVLAHKPSIHLSWETVLFSVMGYYNHWAWKAMYDSSFPTPFPLPLPELSHSLGSRNTERKHFFPSRENTIVSGKNFTAIW